MPSDEFVVHTDRAAIHRRHGGILALHAALGILVVVMIIWVSSLNSGPLAIAPELIVLIGQIFQLSYHSFIYGSRIAISEPLTINKWGFAMNTAAGRMEVPWEAVLGIQTRRWLWHRLLVLQLHPQTQPGSPGIETDISPGYWVRMRRYGGPSLGEKGIQESYDQILQAVAYFSQGRVQLSGAGNRA